MTYIVIMVLSLFLTFAWKKFIRDDFRGLLYLVCLLMGFVIARDIGSVVGFVSAIVFYKLIK